jgi:hypothetical protein
MASDNPFDPKYSKGLLGFLDNPPVAKPTNALADLVSTPGVSDLFRALSPQSPLASPFSLAGSQPTASNALSGAAVSDLFGAMNPAANTFGGGLGAVSDLFAPLPPANAFGGALADILGLAEPASPYTATPALFRVSLRQRLRLRWVSARCPAISRGLIR